MDRRTFLAVSSIAGLVGVSGCLAQTDDETDDGGGSEEEPDLPDGMTVETYYTMSFVFEEYPTRDPDDDRLELYEVIEDRDTADDTLDPALDATASFVEETPFDDSYLLIVQNGMQSQPDLELAAIEREDQGLYIDVSIDPPDGDIDDDWTVHTLLLRITDEIDGPPEEVTLDIEGYV